VELGVDINTPDDNGITPMERAVEEGRVDLIRVLTELGADIRRVLFLYI
jgi:ankyrin repeat protein